MLQPPLTLPSGSPWDPCIDVQPLLCVSIATIMSSSAGCLSALHQRPQTPRDSHEGSSGRGARGQTATRAQNASFHQMRASR